MLYKTFNSLKKVHGKDYFTSRIDNEIVQNLNPICNINLTYFKFVAKLKISKTLISSL